MDILKFSTIGSVDDGKSTLIGRLLYDTKSIPKDQIDSTILATKKRGDEDLDLAFLTDGLIAERQQGITIDVSYKYFSSKNRKYIISDCPGHVEYTKNMITGISESDLIILLIDSSKGVLEQTKRHYYIAQMMGITQFIICVNKMDLVNNDQSVFNEIKTKFLKLIDSEKTNISFVPTSALLGDNVVKKSKNIMWYSGLTVYEILEKYKSEIKNKTQSFRFPVQYVIRHQSDNKNKYRGYAGRVDNGTVCIGDEITVLPSGKTSTIYQIDVFDTKVSQLNYNAWGTVLLKDDIDVSRGDILVKTNENFEIKNELNAIICWMDSTPLSSKSYLFKQGTNEIKCKIIDLLEILNVNHLKFEPTSIQDGFHQNQIIKSKIKLSKPCVIDMFSEIKRTGCFVLIDEQSNLTVASGIII